VSTSPSPRQTDGVRCRDGVTLAFDVYLPDGAGPWPAVVMYIPYGKDAWLGVLHEPHFRFLAAAGFAAVVCDFRGTGASGGRKADAFEAQESDDVYDLVEGVAAFPWCDGNVGIWGVSYGGITALRAGGARPPHLRALVAIEGSTDPYAYEVMRYGAPGLAMISAEWATMMLCLNAVPPISGSPAGDVADVHGEHLDALTPWDHVWRDHPTRDDYWQGRDVDPARIEVPAFIVTSWRDTNPAGAWRDYQAIPGEKRIIAGPWQHGLPDEDATAPIHCLYEIAVWFDRWLRGVPAADSDAPPVWVYVLGSDVWESHREWPPPGTVRTLFLGSGGTLAETAAGSASRAAVRFDATVGINGGLGMAHAPSDQSGDDERSTVFETEPLRSAIDIAGPVLVALTVGFAEARSDIAVRLSDVAPGGVSTLITKGFLRLANPPPFTGAAVPPPSASVVVECNPTRFHVAAGHRIRLAVAAADFPEIWPARTPADLSLELGGPHGCSVSLPVLDRPVADRDAPSPFRPPDPALVAPATSAWIPTLDVEVPDEQGRAAVTGGFDLPYRTLDGRPAHLQHRYRISTVARRPDLTEVTTSTSFRLEQPQGRVEVRTRTSATPDQATAEMDYLVGDVTVATRAFRAGPSS
jgi:putative CocE/NonD family hydrolase